ncbi:MAG TPA: hypothetical protein VLE43_01330 [Candidatus Saccharimonadia bacterium]|nr:hypothetical protein [Candidatus Saccharimonadia bacterium]
MVLGGLVVFGILASLPKIDYAIQQQDACLAREIARCAATEEGLNQTLPRGDFRFCGGLQPSRVLPEFGYNMRANDVENAVFMMEIAGGQFSGRKSPLP